MDTLHRETLRRAALDRLPAAARARHPWDRALELDGDAPDAWTAALDLDRVGVTPFDDAVGALLDAPPEGLPPIRRVRMGMSAREGTAASWKRLLARDGWRAVSTLDLTAAKLGAVTALVADAPHLAGVTALHLRDTGFKRDALAASKALTKLDALDVSANGLAVDDLAALLSTTALARLTTLRAYALAPPAKGTLAPLANSPAMGRLERLALSFVSSPQMQRDALWAPLFGADGLSSLRALDLGGAPYTPAAAKQLMAARMPRLASLKLALPDAALGAFELPALRALQVFVAGPKGLATLAAQPWLPSLRRLTVHVFPGMKLGGLAAVYERLRDVEAFELLLAEGSHAEPELRAAWSLPRWNKLKTLRITGCPPSLERLDPLLASGALRGLETLHLQGAMGPKAAKRLAACEDLASLTTLYTLQAELKDEGVAALCESPHLTKLQRLGLKGTAVGKAGLEALTATDHLRDLVELAVDVSAKAPAPLREALATHPKMPWLWALDAGPDGALSKVLDPRHRTVVRGDGITVDPLLE